MVPERGAARPGRDWLWVVLFKATIGALLLSTGFRAVSDDDYARVVIAQGFAHQPKLDPTGTSWLPFPFWWTGGIMRLVGDSSLNCARAIAFVTGVLSALLVFAAARLLVPDRRGALVGALLASAFPWSARLGVATVPELPTAALSLFAAATLASRSDRIRLAGGAALLAATWSRYEPWSLACAFVFAQLFPSRLSSPTSGRARFGSSVLALVGPLSWMLHNVITHGDALHFLARVAAYKRAVAGDDPLAVLAYPLALVREEPELWLVGAVCVFAGGRRLATGPWRGPVFSLASMVAALTLAAARGGAPTHHNGRALLVVWLAVAIAVGAALYAMVRRPGARRLVALSATAIVLALGAWILRPWYARLDAMSARSSEEEAGRLTTTVADPILLEVRDFGFFAVQAGSGAPWRFVLDRTIDPREPAQGGSFDAPERLRARVRQTGARHVLGYASVGTEWLGLPVAQSKSWRLWRVPSTSAP